MGPKNMKKPEKAKMDFSSLKKFLNILKNICGF